MSLSAAVIAGVAALPNGSTLATESQIGSTAITAEAATSSTVLYNLDTTSTFKNRTKTAVSDRYYKAYYTQPSGSISSTEASTSKPYVPGVLKKQTVKSMQAMTDYYRWLVGVNPLKVSCVPTASLQYQALDRNFEFNHYISNSSKPSDMSTSLWEKGFECNHNILAMGYGAQGAITGWMNEGYSTYTNTWDTLGHRYAMIGSSLSEIQYGYSGSVAIGVCNSFNNGTAKEALSAFPAPGYNPSNLIYNSSSAWSFELNSDKVYADDSSDVKVKVTNLSTKKSYTCTVANGKLIYDWFYNGYFAFTQPTDADYNYEDSYRVDITGLKDTSTGKAAEVKYTVKFVDVSSMHYYGYKTKVVSPTYTSKGYTIKYCECGKYKKTNYTAAKTVPTVVTKSNFGCGTNAVRINWKKVSGVSGYRIFRYDESTKKWKFIGKVENNTTFTYKDTKNLKAGTVYKYKVQAYAKGNGTCAYGKSGAVIYTSTKPADTSRVRTVTSSSASKIYWKKVRCSGYRIDRYDSATKKWVKVKYITDSSTTMYRFGDLKKNTSYKFRVTPYVKVTDTKRIAGNSLEISVKTKKS
jgi:hypothetical protein